MAAASLRPEMVISLLTREFAHIDERKCASEEERAVELRTKIGEALARVTENLGEMTPKYRDVFFKQSPFVSLNISAK